MLNRPTSRAVMPRRRQRGDILLITMVFLLLCLLGLISSMRDTVVSTTQAGNTLARQRDTQVADLARQSLYNTILTTAPAGMPLTTSTAITSQAWWRNVSPTSNAAPPSASYWANCLGNSDSTQRCGQITLTVGSTNLPYTALAVVQPTGRSDPNSPQCNVGNGLAQGVFYAVFIHIVEQNGATVANTESVYQTCEQKS